MDDGDFAAHLMGVVLVLCFDGTTGLPAHVPLLTIRIAWRSKRPEE